MVARQRPGAAVPSGGVDGGECHGHTVVPDAERTRNGGNCPNSLGLKHERQERFPPAKACQYHTSSCKISSFSKVRSNPLQLLE